MGAYLNPGNRKFQISLNSKIYVDKSLLIQELNELIDTSQRFVCVTSLMIQSLHEVCKIYSRRPVKNLLF